MRRIFFLFALTFLFGVKIFAKQDAPLMTIDGKPVSKSYFEYVFSKNNSLQHESKKTLDEYVELFKNFKLKVVEAEHQGLDTLNSFISELAGYRNQLVAPYFTDKDKKEQLVQDIYRRMTEDVDVSHILISVGESASEADTLAAYKRALNIEKRLKKEDFAKVAREESADSSAKINGGRLGYMNVFWTPYSFETAAYNTPVGKISKPIRTAYGYHIIKVNGKRASRGKVLVAHILKLTNDTIPGYNEQMNQEIRKVYAELKAGNDFASLAKKHSDDTYSAERNGELPWFGMGEMVPEFENIAFSLKNKGDFSTPIKTAYGWHIVKLLDKKPLESFEELRPIIEQQVEQGEYSELIKTSFVNNLKKKYNLQLVQKAEQKLEKIAEKASNMDSVFYQEAEKLNETLFKISDLKYLTDDFISFMKQKRLSIKNVSKNVDTYLREELINYYDSHLESEFDNLKNLMQEYRDGILLFDISNKEVWEKAGQDTIGLKHYFETNKDKYQWNEARFKGQVLLCNSKKTAQKVESILKKSPKDSIVTHLNRLNKDGIVVKSVKGLFKEGANKTIDHYVFKTGDYNPSDDFQFGVVDGKVLNAPEVYTDVRGWVIQDYQNFLEQEWVKKLQSKYSVIINEQVLKTVNNKQE